MFSTHNLSLSNTLFCMDNIYPLNISCHKFLVTNDNQNNINSNMAQIVGTQNKADKKKCKVHDNCKVA